MEHELGTVRRAACSRRHLLGRALGLGAAILLAACGGTPTPTAKPNPPPAASSTPASVATAAATATAAPAATASRATTPASVATPGQAGTLATATRAASATPGVAAGGEFARLLGLVPRADPLPGREGVSFADLARQKRNYGLEGATSAEAFAALGADTARVNRVFAALQLPPEAGVDRARDPAWRATLGYDFWQIDRTVAAGSPPGTWTRLEGRFDRAAIEAALAAAGHKPVDYGGATILARGEDAQIVDLNQSITRLTLARLNRVALGDGALAATPYTALAQAGIDTGAGRGPSFADDPGYLALAAALGSVVAAQIIPGESFFRQTIASPRVTPAQATAIATRLASPDRPRLHPYQLVGLGLRDDGRSHTMVIGLLYADAADARADAPVLRGRAADYVLLANRQPLRERAVAGEPEIVASGAGAALILPLAIADEANLGLWRQMLGARDYAFLAE